MSLEITQKIVGYSVKADPIPESTQSESRKVIEMHENVRRPEVLVGSTYKIKSPLVEHAMYVTVNDIVLNSGTEHELRRPFEIFINSRNMDHFQWIVALTRIMSAVFRKGGDVTFLVDEMKAVFDPRGGYIKPGGGYMPSIVAEIGVVIEAHMKSIGLIVEDELSEDHKRLIAQKREAYEAREKPADDASVGGDDTGFPQGSTLCMKCNTTAIIIMDGCATCLNCGYSKCG